MFVLWSHRGPPVLAEEAVEEAEEKVMQVAVSVLFVWTGNNKL